MIVAREKYRKNIVEYILYMYQIEDIIRANQFDMNKLEKNVIEKYTLPADQMIELRAWYKNLIDQMIHEELQENGHLQSLKELIFELNDLHIQLLNTLEEDSYLENYHWASPYINELKEKMKIPEMTEIEVCLNGLYGYMLLKLKRSEISEETSQAMSVFSHLLGHVSKKYHERIAIKF